MAICHPLRAHSMNRLIRVRVAIVAIWVVSALSALPVTTKVGLVCKVGWVEVVWQARGDRSTLVQKIGWFIARS